VAGLADIRRVAEAPEPFGAPSRYYADPKAARPGSGRLNFRLPFEELKKAGIPERVERSVREWNQRIRDQLRAETGLSLSAAGKQHAAVSIEVIDGYPEAFAQILEAAPPIVWRLRRQRRLLSQAAAGLRLVESELQSIASEIPHAGISMDKKLTLSSAREVLEQLLKVLEKDDVVEQFKKVDEDILGAYFFHHGRIELYWAVIGIIAGTLDVEVEDLSAVVLTHELAHAYTHLGRDIDGNNWVTGAFAKAESALVEGLAQFYTAMIADRLGERRPGITKACEALLGIQGGPYLQHQHWTEGKDDRIGEAVRFAMVAARSNQIATAAGFAELFKAARERLRLERTG
jgi:hypothetical protein